MMYTFYRLHCFLFFEVYLRTDEDDQRISDVIQLLTNYGIDFARFIGNGKSLKLLFVYRVESCCMFGTFHGSYEFL